MVAEGNVCGSLSLPLPESVKILDVLVAVTKHLVDLGVDFHFVGGNCSPLCPLIPFSGYCHLIWKISPIFVVLPAHKPAWQSTSNIWIGLANRPVQCAYHVSR
jgi:hypothetical protein